MQFDPPTEVQGLAALLAKKDAEIAALQAQVAEVQALRAQLARCETFLMKCAAIFPALEACQAEQQHLWAEFKQRRQPAPSAVPTSPPCAQ